MKYGNLFFAILGMLCDIIGHIEKEGCILFGRVTKNLNTIHPSIHPASFLLGDLPKPSQSCDNARAHSHQTGKYVITILAGRVCRAHVKQVANSIKLQRSLRQNPQIKLHTRTMPLSERWTTLWKDRLRHDKHTQLLKYVGSKHGLVLASRIWDM